MAKKKYSGATPVKDDGWQAESDLRTLIDAQKIRKDPGRLRAALKKRDEMRTALGGIRGKRS